MKKRYDAVATVGKYKDRQTGEEKKRYMTCGAVFEDDNGRLALKLDGVPCSPDWSGWISFYEPKDQQSAPQRQQPTAHQQGKQNGYAPQADESDDIPF